MPCSTSEYTGGQKDNDRFANYLGNVDITVGKTWEPRNLKELVYILERAEREGFSVHARGAGYSFEETPWVRGSVTAIGWLRPARTILLQLVDATERTPSR